MDAKKRKYLWIAIAVAAIVIPIAIYAIKLAVFYGRSDSAPSKPATVAVSSRKQDAKKDSDTKSGGGEPNDSSGDPDEDDGIVLRDFVELDGIELNAKLTDNHYAFQTYDGNKFWLKKGGQALCVSDMSANEDLDQSALAQVLTGGVGRSLSIKLIVPASLCKNSLDALLEYAGVALEDHTELADGSVVGYLGSADGSRYYFVTSLKANGNYALTLYTPEAINVDGSAAATRSYYEEFAQAHSNGMP